MNNQYDRIRTQNGGNPPARSGNPQSSGQAANGQSGFSQPGLNQPGLNQPGYNRNAYNQPGANRSAYPQGAPGGQQNPGLNAPGRGIQGQSPSGYNPQNPAVRNGAQGNYPRNAYPQNGNPQNGQRQGGAYNPRGAYPANRPASATGAAYGSRAPGASGSAAGRRQRDAMVNRQTATAQRREKVRRVKRPFRFNWGVALFVLLCAAVLGVSIWQISRAGWNENRIAVPDGPVTNAELSASESGTGLPDAPDAGEQGTEDSAGGTPVSEPGASGSEENSASGSVTPQEPYGEEPAGNAETPAEEPVVNLTLYDTVTVDNAGIDQGNLVLVNASHGYSAGDAYVNQLKNAYLDRTGRLKVASTDIGLLPVAFDALERLVIDLEEDTGSHDLLITSGHRTVAEQQEIWDYYLNINGEAYVNAYVAKPGFSEHNTGLACDVSFYTDDGASIPVSEYEHGWWLAANCAREGFIRRYPEDKVDITGIANEPWHFRYVGIPHARICSSRNWCLEEYIEGVKTYTADGVMLYVAADGTVSEVNAADGLPTSGGWLVYYVPKTGAGGVTEVRVPRGSDYEISGNNEDGFIVTVDLR